MNFIYQRPLHQAYSSTTPASKALSKQLQIVMQLLQAKDNEFYNKYGIRRCWFIRSLDDVFLEIKQHQEFLKKRNPRTFDFSTMYACLIHERIIKNVRIAIEWAKEYAHQLNSTDGRRHYNTASGLAPTEWIMQHVEFVVKNTFFYNGKVVRHQEIGLPMGTNSAQELANLTLHVDEAIFIDSLIKAKQIEEAKQHSDNFRLIDDIFIGRRTPNL